MLNTNTSITQLVQIRIRIVDSARVLVYILLNLFLNVTGVILSAVSDVPIDSLIQKEYIYKTTIPTFLQLLPSVETVSTAATPTSNNQTGHVSDRSRQMWPQYPASEHGK